MLDNGGVGGRQQENVSGNDDDLREFFILWPESNTEVTGKP